MARGAVKVRDPYRVPLAQRLGNPALLRDSRPAPVSTSVTSADGQMGWHSTAWGYYDLVGEDHYYVTFYGSCFSRIGLRLGWLGDDEEPGPVYDEDGTPKDGIDPVLAELGTKAVRGLRARPGGQSGLMKSIGQNLSQTGKLYIVGHDKPSRHFEVCSTSELKASPNYIPGRDDTPRWAKVRRPGDNGVDLPPETFVLPILNPHPQFKELPDSAIRPLLNVLERLALLDAEHLSLIRSRLANAGLWAVADEIELPPVPGASTDDEPFQAMLMKVAGAAMIDKSSPAAWLPIVVRMAKEFVKTGEGINVIDPPDPSKPKTAERRNAAVDDMARGVDLPPEALKGHANTTFSNAYKIDEDTYKTHVAPLATVPTSVLTEGYLHPQLMGYLGLDPEDSEMPENVERLVIYPDAVALVGRPQMGDIVKWGVGTERQPNFVVSLAGARELTGIPDQMRPDDDEIAERLHRAQLLNARETVQGIPGENQDASGGEIPGVGPVTNGSNPNGNRAASRFDRLALQIEVVADTLADRAVRRAGALLRNKVRGKDEHRAAMAGCDGDMARLPSALGSELCASLLSDSDPLAAERPTMEARVRAYAAESEHPDPEAVVAGAVGLLVALTRERMLRPGASVKAGQVAALVRAKA